MAGPSDDVLYALETASRRTGVPLSTLTAIARRESTFNPNAVNKETTATGLMQFIDGTWADTTAKYGAKYGITSATSRFDPLASALMAGEYALENAKYIEQKIGRKARPGETYVSHFMGGGGAVALIKAAEANPDAEAAKLFGAQAKANPTIFYNKDGSSKTVSEVYSNLMATVEGSGIRQYATSPDYTPDTSRYAPQDADQGPSFLDTAGAVIETTPSYWLVQQALGMGELDENFSLSADRIESLIKENNLPANQGWEDRISRALSEEHLNKIISNAKAHVAAKETIANAGLTGAALEIASSVLDPVTLTAEAMTGGLAAAAIGGARATRAMNALRGAAIAGSSTAGGEVVAGAVMPDRGSAGQVAFAGVMGVAFGGLFGSLARRAATAPEAAQIARIGKEALKDSTSLSKLGNPGSVGAAATEHMDTYIMEEAIGKLLPDDAPKSFMGALRWDMAGRLRNSTNPAARLIFGQLAKDGAGAREGEILRTAVTEDKAMLRSEFVSRFYRRFPTAAKEFVKETGREADEFRHQLFEYITYRGADAETKYSRSVVSLGNEIRKMQEELGTLASNPLMREGLTGRAVRGFEEFTRNKFYMARKWHDEKVANALQEFGEANVVKLLTKAALKANPDLLPESAAKFAKGFTKAIRMRAHGFKEGMPLNIAHDSIEVAREEMLGLADDLGMNKADIKAIFDQMKPKNSDAGVVDRAKRRAMFDEHTQLEPDEYLLPTGVPGEKPLRFMDLIETDAEKLFLSYADQMSGYIAFARMRVTNPATGEMLVNGVTSDADWKKLLDTVRTKGLDEADKRRGSVSTSQIKADEERANRLRDLILGRPIANISDETRQFLRLIKKFNFVRVMNQAGFAQIPEVAGMITTMGIKAAFSHMPAFRRIITGDGEHILKSGFAHDMETFGMIGIERLTREEFVRLGDMTGDIASESSKAFLNKTERLLDKASHISGDISGMQLANMALQRWTGMATMQKLVDVAHSGRGMSKGFKARMASIGVSDDMAERIFKQLTDPSIVKTEKGLLTGNKIKRFNAEAMTDLEAKVALQQGIFRLNRQIIQQSDPGMMAQWMSHPVAGIFTQFRSFVGQAYVNNLLYNINMAGQGNLMSGLMLVILNSTMAAAVYAAQEHIRAAARSDRDEYLEKRLSWDNLAKAAFARSSYSSVIPMLMDSGPSQIFGDGPMFDFRTTEQPSNALWGNPTMATMDQVVSGLKGISQPILGGRAITQKEARDISRLLPFGNSIPMVLLTDTLIRGLDDRPPRKY